MTAPIPVPKGSPEQSNQPSNTNTKMHTKRMKELHITILLLLGSFLWITSCGTPPQAGLSSAMGAAPSPPDPSIPSASKKPSKDPLAGQICLAVFSDVIGSNGEKAFGDTRTFWPKEKKELKIRFLNGSEKTKTAIQKAAMEWTNYINIKFKFGDYYPADIRIDTSIPRYHRSLVGTDNEKQSDDSKPTMWIGVTAGFLGDSVDSIRRVTLHEFGHALGLKHEHQHPQNSILWNKPKVLKYYASLGGEWEDPAFVEQWVFRREPSSNHTGSYDPNSIMHYSVPAEHTLDGWHTEWSYNLSNCDTTFIASKYPKTL